VLKSSIQEACLILALALGAALLVNGLRSDGLSLFAPGAPISSGSVSGPSEREISLDEAMRRHSDQSAIFADARSAADFEAGHIQGALSLPDHEFDAWIEAFIAGTEPETVIITYCEGFQCVLSKSLADKLIDLGFVNTRYLSDGWGRWKERKLPMGAGR
jgi:rhodanese-related sulfurtransferase